MSRDAPELTVYYDGACPLCRAEIDHYQRQDGANAICFQDISQPGSHAGPDLGRQAAMARLHARRDDGSLISGAAAFVGIWQMLPRWQWAARLARLPGMMTLLEASYRLFLPARPWLVRLLGRFAGRP